MNFYQIVKTKIELSLHQIATLKLQIVYALTNVHLNMISSLELNYLVKVEIK